MEPSPRVEDEIIWVYGEICRLRSRRDKVEAMENLTPRARVVWKRLLREAMDPFRVFGIRTENMSYPEPTLPIPDTGILHDYFSLLDRLAEKKVTGSKARLEAASVLRRAGDLEPILRAVLNKDLRLGLGPKSLNKVYPKLIPVFSPMLCDKYDGSRLEGSYWVEPKLDGMRVLLVFPEDGSPSAFSRNGKPVLNLDRFLQGLHHHAKGYVIDTELYAGSWAESITAGKREGSETLAELWAFDIVPIEAFRAGDYDEPLTSRRKRLMAVHDAVSLEGFRLTPRKKVKTPEDVWDVVGRLMERGYEGGVLKDAQSPYMTRRSPAWRKITRELLPGSEEHDEDFEIVDVVEGKGRHVGRLGALVCETEEGRKFKVGTGLSDEDRIRYWEKPSRVVGHHAQVRFREYTPDGVPRFPVFVRLREDK